MHELRFAGFWIRAAAHCLDWLVQGVVGFAAALLLIAVAFFVDGLTGGAGAEHFVEGLGETNWVAWIGGPLAVVAYHAMFEGIAGTTVGKRLLKLQVIGEGGFPPTFVQGVKRSIAFLVDALFFGAIAWSHMKDSPDQQRIGDAWARTRVAYRESVPPHLRPSTLRFLGAFVAALAVTATFDIATEVLGYLWRR